MSRLPERVVQLSSPIVMEHRHTHDYVVGKTSQREIADNVNPMVSGHVKKVVESDGSVSFSVSVSYCYNKCVPPKDMKFHEYTAVEDFDNLRDAVKRAYSLVREAYSDAIYKGIAISLEGRV